MDFIQVWIVMLVSTFASNIGHAKKISLTEYDIMEKARINQYNQTRVKFGLQPIQINPSIMGIAKKLANMMKTSPGSLTLPKISVPQNYRGYVTVLTDVTGNKKKGTKLCFSNMIRYTKPEIIDINKQCDQGPIDWRYEYEVGYGRSVDQNNNIYGVRIYLTRQKVEDTEHSKDITKKPTTPFSEDEDYDEEDIDRAELDKTAAKSLQQVDYSQLDRAELDSSLLKDKDEITDPGVEHSSEDKDSEMEKNNTEKEDNTEHRLDQESLNLIQKIIGLLKSDAPKKR